MEKRKTQDGVIAAIEKTPWAITPDGLELVLGIAQRQISEPETATERRKSYEAKSIGSNSDGIMVFDIFGPIFPRANMFTNVSGAASVESCAQRFSEALQDDSIKAIVLNIDSPGGQITGVHEFANAIYKARGTKPIYAYVCGQGASAAYWIASAADKIYCDATAQIGSIGIVAAWSDSSEQKKRDGIKDYQIVSSQSPNKRLDPTTEKGREALQKNLDACAEIFISDVARNRGVSAETVRENFGKGGMIIANEAEYNRMCDGLSSLEGVIADLKNVSLSQIGVSAMTEQETEANKFSSEKLENKETILNPDDGVKEAAGGVVNPPAASGGILNEAKLLASNPTLYNAIVQKGVMHERERIKAIDAMDKVVDNKALIEDAKFSNPCSAQELAYKILQAESKAGRSFLANFADDKKELDGVAGSVQTDANSFSADVATVTAGYKGGQK